MHHECPRRTGELARAITQAQEGDIAALGGGRGRVRTGYGTDTPAGARHSSADAHRDRRGNHPGSEADDSRANACEGPGDPIPGAGDAGPRDHLVITVAEIPGGIPEYDRSEWKHWVDEDGDCQDARQEVLIEESLEPVTFEDDRQCRVEAGRWWAPYLGHHLGNPRHIDVDHHVPLKNAHLSGGWAWSPEEKERYANYLDDPGHLIAISSRHNRSKGARGPEEWAPPDNDLWCQYALDWTEIKQRWGLTMTPVESEIVMDMLGTCADPPEVELEAMERLMIVPGQDKPEEEDLAYSSCEEAAAAGVQRVQGNQGEGQGFPKEMVPSARDGDGDGIVCER